MSLLDTDSGFSACRLYAANYRHIPTPSSPLLSPEHQLTWREEGPICTGASEEARTQDRNGTKKEDVVHDATTYMHGAVRGG